MVRRQYALIVALALVAAMLAVQGASAQTTYTITVKTDASSYTSGQHIKISGTVSPPPGASTGVTIRIFNPAGQLVDPVEAFPNAVTGAFNCTTIAGGSAEWTTGTYTVNATWGAYPPAISHAANFTYSASATTSSTTSSTTTSSTTHSTTSTTTSSTTTSTTATTTTSTTSSTTTAQTSASTSSSTTSSSASPIPEFPYQAAFAGLFFLLIAAAYVLVRRTVALPATRPSP